MTLVEDHDARRSEDSGAHERLRVGIVAPPWVAVPPPVYGGTELVIDLLARGLQAAGHEVVLCTTGDSTCPVPRRFVYPTALGTTAHADDEIGHLWYSHDALRGNCVDVVHDHTLIGPRLARTTLAGMPLVTTVHGPFLPGITEHYAAIARRAAVVAISHHQRSTAPDVDVARVIHHGIDVDRQTFGAGDGDYVLFLGRMSPDKGVHLAIEVARRAGRRLLIAAKMWEAPERQYFRTFVEPLLGAGVVYLGEVSGQQKQDVLAGAEALVNPIRWPEPFGLVMVEALAAGTPVVSFAAGAAPEIVDDARTGFICRDVDDMVTRLGDIGSIDRAVCRASATERFSAERMVRDHVELYRSVIDATPASTSRSSRRRSAV
jgi:glycosyltransferase involved in cell wall biosynthesis